MMAKTERILYISTILALVVLNIHNAHLHSSENIRSYQEQFSGETFGLEPFPCGNQGRHSQLATTTDKRSYMFLHDSWEQFNAGKVTVKEFAWIAVLSNKTAVMPFLMEGTVSFAGHVKHPTREAISPMDTHILSLLPVEWAPFEDAMRSCKDRFRIVHIMHDKDGKSGCVNEKGDRNWKEVEQAKTLWKTDAVDCFSTWDIPVDYFLNQTNCLVVHGFHGLRNGDRGNFIYKHSKEATDRARAWEQKYEFVLRNYGAFIEASKSAALIPSHNDLVTATSCGFGRWGDVYDVLQFRLESIFLWTRSKLNNASLGVQMKEVCILNTVGYLNEIRGNDTSTPVVIIYDEGKYGSRSAKGNVHTSNIKKLVTSVLDGTPKVFISSECPVFHGCAGPLCFFLDMTIYAGARFAVQNPGGGSSATTLKAVRSSANKMTMAVRSMDFANTTCPLAVMERFDPE